MIHGRVTADLQAIVPLHVGHPQGTTTEIEAVIDTGFNGFLALPPGVIEELRLPFCGPASATLGDGRDVELPVYEAVAGIGDRLVDAEVLETSAGILAGMALLRGFELRMQIVEDGLVSMDMLS